MNLYPFQRRSRAARHARGGGRRDDRHRRPVDAARGREELRARRAVVEPGTTPACSPSCATRARLSPTTRRALAAEAFATTAAYEAAIANWFAGPRAVPGPADALVQEGARPRVRRESAPARRLLRRGGRARSTALDASSQLHGKAALATTTCSTSTRARLLLREFAVPACVIVKHANPCGVAVGATSRRR